MGSYHWINTPALQFATKMSLELLTLFTFSWMKGVRKLNKCNCCEISCNLSAVYLELLLLLTTIVTLCTFY